jgi:hypothetical protein
MIMIVFVVLIMIALGVFFLVSSVKPTISEYENLYVHNLILTVLRTDTGYRSPCTTISETMSSVALTPGRNCGGKINTEILDESVPLLIENILGDKYLTKYDYYIKVEPENYEVAGGISKSYGNQALETRQKKWVANEKILQYQSNLRIMLILAEA